MSADLIGVLSSYRSWGGALTFRAFDFGDVFGGAFGGAFGDAFECRSGDFRDILIYLENIFLIISVLLIEKSHTLLRVLEGLVH